MTTFQILLQQEDDRWIARNMDLGVTSQGTTIEEALANIKEATELYLEDVEQSECPALSRSKQFLLTSIQTTTG